MADNTQTQLQINTLRTLQESYDALVEAQSAQATATALEAAKQAILTAIDNIDTSDLAKEATLNAVGLDAAAAKIAAQSIIIPTDYAKQGSDSTATNTAQMGVLNTIATNMYKGIPIVSQSGNATISPNMYNIWSNVSTDLVVTKGNDISGIVNEYALRFTLDSTWVTDTNTITFSGWQLDWNGGSVPTWTAGHTYEISIINNIALWVDIEPTV